MDYKNDTAFVSVDFRLKWSIRTTCTQMNTQINFMKALQESATYREQNFSHTNIPELY